MEKLNPKDIRDIIALTPMQEGMLFHYLHKPGSDLYFEQLSLEINGNIDVQFFEKAWNTVIEANEMLRTLFRWENLDHPVQIILKDHQLDVSLVDFSREEFAWEKWEELKEKDREKKFDLLEVPFRVTLCKLEEQKYRVIISNHHILYDGWSNGIILREFFRAYTRLCRGDNRGTPPGKTKFKDFLQMLQTRDTREQEKFWREYLNIPRFPHRGSNAKKKRKTGKPLCPREYVRKLPGKVQSRLEDFVKEHHITMASFFYNAWGLLLQHYHECTDVLFDATVSGRNSGLKGMEDMVGLFINTLPIRVNTLPAEKIKDFLQRMNHMLETWSGFSTTSPLTVNELLDGWRDRHLFDSVMVIENYPLDNILREINAAENPLSIESFSATASANYDIAVIITPFAGIKLTFIYDENLLNEDILERLSAHFIEILEEIVEFPGKTAAGLGVPVGIRAGIDFLKGNRESGPGEAGGDQDPGTVPLDSIELELQQIWQGVLGKKPAVNDNFFEIGGDSIALIRIYKQVNQRYPGKITVNDFFCQPTIGQLKELLVSSPDNNKNTSIKQKQIKKIRKIDF